METTYRISSEDANKIHEWLREEVYPAAVAYQKQTDPKDFRSVYEESWEAGYPYTGAIGGAMSYVFSPTSIGDHVSVIYKIGDFRRELDLTDYSRW